MYVQTAAIEIARKRPGAVCLALHPGTVKTTLSDPFSGTRDRFHPDDAARKLLDVVDRAQPTGAATFLAHDGSEIAW